MNKDIIKWNNKVSNIIKKNIEDTSLAPLLDDLSPILTTGKMLRSRIPYRMSKTNLFNQNNLVVYSATVEMLHIASLLHDDVIDGASIRRKSPTFWKEKGMSGAILLGDLLVAKALVNIVKLNDLSVINDLLDALTKVCDTEIKQELISKGDILTLEQCIDIARNKTGALFAFIASACEEQDIKLKLALREAGYLIGTAYQLSDDILDASGNETVSGKTLGTDKTNSKYTIANLMEKNINIESVINKLYADSINYLSPWKKICSVWETYILEDIKPIIDKHLMHI